MRALLALLTSFYVLLSNPSFAASSVCKAIYLSDLRVPSSMLRIQGSLGKGQSSLAYLATVKNKSVAFIQSQAIDTPLISISFLTEKEKRILSTLSLQNAFEIVRHVYAQQKMDLSRIGLDVPNPQRTRFENDRLERIEQLSIAISELIVNYDHLKSIQNLMFQGKRITPLANGIVVDSNQIPIGFLVEVIAGNNLVKSLEKGLLNRKQFEAIQKSVLDQASALHRAGFVHGDLNPGNVMVEILPNGSVQVRLIDPVSPSLALISTPDFDFGIFHWGIRNLEKKFPISD